jgi:hypothetical protein
MIGMATWLLRILAALGALILAGILVGSMLPRKHVASKTAAFRQTPEAIWKLLVEVEAGPAWRPGVKKAERLEDRYGNLTWRETDQRGQAIVYEATESAPPRRQVRTIVEKNLPFGGNWVIEIQPADGGSRVTVTENGEIYNPVFRLMARFVLGYTGSIETFLRDMGKRLGEGSAGG